jgi:prepilin-type N-terminal cleavage/methylation domain-containing protein
MRGFTLMETLLALAIFATLSLAIMTGLIVMAKQGENTWQNREALDLAISRLEVERYNGPLREVTSNAYTFEYSEDKNPIYKIASVTVSSTVSRARYDFSQVVTLSRVIQK